MLDIQASNAGTEFLEWNNAFTLTILGCLHMFMSINIQWTGAKAIMLACGISIFIRHVQ